MSDTDTASAPAETFSSARLALKRDNLSADGQPVLRERPKTGNILWWPLWATVRQTPIRLCGQCRCEAVQRLLKEREPQQ